MYDILIDAAAVLVNEKTAKQYKKEKQSFLKAKSKRKKKK